jgi:hypothetical protein
MGVRESFNQNKRLGVGAAVGIVIVGLGIIGIQLIRGGDSGVTVSDQAFYTDDNGKSFFKDDFYKIVPFDHNGKQAYRADVFQCPDGKQFVGLMYRHNAVGKKAMEKHLAKRGNRQDVSMAGIEIQGMDVKPAGAPDTAWKPNTGEASVKCPSGGTAQPVRP